MKNKATFILAGIIVVCFFLYAITFQVDYNEVAVVTTFGRADESSVYHGNEPGAGIMGNLHWRWPWPIQQVRTYDRRVRVFDEQPEQQQTLDNSTVILSTYVTWRIEDPLQFFRTMRETAQAERQLRARVRDARSIIGNYTFDQLTNTDPEQIRLAEVEQAILERLREEDGGTGVAIESVGIKRIILPEQVTQNVFERMRVTRERLAQGALSEGEASAANIRARAENARRTIMAFAERRADSIRAQGDEAAAQYYEVFKQDEQFAIFLRNMDAYREIFPHNTTFFFDAKEGGLGREFYYGPTLPEAQPASSPTQAEDEPAEDDRTVLELSR